MTEATAHTPHHDSAQGAHQAEPGHAHAHGHTHGDGAGAGGGLVEILDLDADVLAGHLASIVGWLPVTRVPERIADLGAGTGAGTFALLDAFPRAQVVALDSSGEHLERLRQKAADRGVADRVRAVRADLDEEPWPDLGAPHLVWASASLHHLADPDRALRAVRDTLAPGGLLALVELTGFPRFLPGTAPGQRPGLEERCHDALAARHAERLPHMTADWGRHLSAAGFAIEAERTVTVDLRPPHCDAVRRYALAGLTRLREQAGDALDPADLVALDRLLDADSPEGVMHRSDLTVHTERYVWAARRA